MDEERKERLRYFGFAGIVGFLRPLQSPQAPHAGVPSGRAGVVRPALGRMRQQQHRRLQPPGDAGQHVDEARHLGTGVLLSAEKLRRIVDDNQPGADRLGLFLDMAE